ncbi:tripartite motif-containing protein 45-like [Ostrea edulis]|uniref:tripartite motif-containing protein 45-like n=1 Tax=Ostrea edulis TaxID=37623 RepID=UPI0024AFB3C4|nr:tripartite motif-containing protein 45-like [Ostrea edulis]
MHPRCSAQEVLLCDVCETVPLQSHCELCKIDLCSNCVVKHLSDSSKRHNVVSYKDIVHIRKYPKCSKHAEKHCELYCEKCDIPVCSTSVSHKHSGHILCDVLKKIGSKTQGLKNDLEELETRTSPRYDEMASDIQTKKAQVETNYGKLSTVVGQQGEIWHQEITAIVNQVKSDIAEMKTKHMAA